MVAGLSPQSRHHDIVRSLQTQVDRRLPVSTRKSLKAFDPRMAPLKRARHSRIGMVHSMRISCTFRSGQNCPFGAFAL